MPRARDEGFEYAMLSAPITIAATTSARLTMMAASGPAFPWQ